MSEPVFELVGLAETEDSPVLLGLWSAAAPEPVSFSVEETGPPVPVWRFNIPDDDDQAEQWLTEGEKRLVAAKTKLANVTPRLDRLIAMSPSLGATSFDTTVATLPQAEQNLLLELEAPPSFGLTDDVGAALEKLRQAVKQYAAAETAHQGQVLGHTTFGWLGDVDTVWATASSKRQVNMHRRTVRLALASKDTTIRLLFLTVQSAAKIMASLAGGGITAAAAVPIAWNYIRQVLAELGELEAIKKES
jgi:hypothetical protein